MARWFMAVHPTSKLESNMSETTKTEAKTSKRRAAKKTNVIDQVSETLKNTEKKMTQEENVQVEDLTGEANYSGTYKPTKAEVLSSSEGGAIRVMRETWNYEDRQGKKQQSTKIAVRPVYRRRDGNLFFAEPLVNIHENKWPQFKKLMQSIKV